MREIKYRLWDKKNKFIYEVNQIDWERGMVKVNTGEWLRNENKGDGKLVTNGERFVLLQYTGLKDNNGVEIYEGNIVIEYRKNEKDIDYRFPKIVFYDEMKAGFYLTYKHMMNKEFQYKYGSFRGDFINSPKKIVIGNIYENSELLENNQN